NVVGIGADPGVGATQRDNYNCESHAKCSNNACNIVPLSDAQPVRSRPAKCRTERAERPHSPKPRLHYGLGGGPVGRGLGVGVDLGATVAVAVGVTVGVTVAVAVAVGVGDAPPQRLTLTLSTRQPA